MLHGPSSAPQAEILIQTAYIQHVEPDWGLAGSEVTIRGQGFGDAQGVQHVYVAGSGSSQEMPVLSWSDSEIRVRVPAVPPLGRYKNVRIRWHGVAYYGWVSNTNRTFTFILEVGLEC